MLIDCNRDFLTCTPRIRTHHVTTNQNGVYSKPILIDYTVTNHLYDNRLLFVENHREEESTTVHLGLSDDDEGLEGSTNDATTQTSGHLPPSDSSPLGKKAT